MEIKLAFTLWFVSRFAYWRRVSQFESMEATSVIIIGAGVAGLAAAGELSAAGFDAIILEARERPGGRVYSVAGMEGRRIELGAEFVHGRKNVTWKLIRRQQDLDDRAVLCASRRRNASAVGLDNLPADREA